MDLKTLFPLLDIFKFAYNLYNATKSSVVRVWLGPKLVIGLCSAEDAEVSTFTIHSTWGPQIGVNVGLSLRESAYTLE